MKLKYTVIIFIFFIFSTLLFPGEIKKPVLRLGSYSYTSFRVFENNMGNLYPNYINDNFYLSFEEQFTPLFFMKHKINFYYSSCNKYSSELYNLQSLYLKNLALFQFKIKKVNKITFSTSPTYYYKYGENYFKILNNIQYRLGLNFFSFTLQYRHQFGLERDEFFIHKFHSGFLWTFPRASFIKYKAALSVYLQHGTREKLDKPLLKNFTATLEIIFDFNKIELKNFNDEDSDIQDQTLWLFDIFQDSLKYEDCKIRKSIFNSGYLIHEISWIIP